MKTVLSTLSLVLLMIIVSCSDHSSQDNNSPNSEFTQIIYGEATCEFTGDVIDEFRYGGKIETNTGDVYTFMSVECLAGFYLNNLDENQVAQIWVTDYNHGKKLITIEEAVFLHSMNRRSPNGLNLTALVASDEKITYNMRFAYGGELIGWDEVLKLVSSEWDIEYRQRS